jgi:RNA polymerase sigma-70 factor (ECF subfamily)
VIENDAKARQDWTALLSRQIALHGALLFRAAFDILKDAADAEDMVQQAFLKAWERRDEIVHAGLLKQWLTRTVVNGSLQTLRRRKTEHRVLKRHASVPASVETPTTEKGELHALLLDAVADLPEMSRTVVVLRVLEGMSGDDVKNLLGCSAAEVSRQLHRGLDQLRRMMNASIAGAKGA